MRKRGTPILANSHIHTQWALWLHSWAGTIWDQFRGQCPPEKIPHSESCKECRARSLAQEPWQMNTDSNAWLGPSIASCQAALQCLAEAAEGLTA